MGELEIIRNGVSTIIARDGSINSAMVKLCDECQKHQSTLGGTSTMYAGDEILWICASCRTAK
jgi:hypothetical protein